MSYAAALAFMEHNLHSVEMFSITKVNSQSQSHTWHCCCSIFSSFWGAHSAAWSPSSPQLLQGKAARVVLIHPLFSMRSLHLELPGLGQGVLPRDTCPSPLISTITWFYIAVCHGAAVILFGLSLHLTPDTDFCDCFHRFHCDFTLRWWSPLAARSVGFWEGSNTCCHRLQHQKELLWFETSIFPFFRVNMGISLPPQGSNLQDRFPGTGRWAATSGAACAVYGDVPSGCCASSQAFLSVLLPVCPRTQARAQSQRVLQMLEHCSVSGEMEISKHPFSIQLCDLLYILPLSRLLCSCAYYLLFFVNKGRCKVIEKYHLLLKLVPELL